MNEIKADGLEEACIRRLARILKCLPRHLYMVGRYELDSTLG
jgi:hypothetical protein